MTATTRERSRHSFARGRFVALCVVALVALKLWLVAWQSVGAEGSARFDDALFVELAHHVKSGDWLGPYNERTLVKGPGYPAWLAFTGALGLPLLPAQHILHALAAAALVVALRRVIPNPWSRLALFAVLLFDPATYETTSMRVVREGIYPALTMFVFAGLVELAGRDRLRAVGAYVVSLATGLALGAFWLTREEGPWILPAVAILLGLAAIRLGRGRRGWRRLSGAAIAALPIVVTVACVAGVAAINSSRYGIATVVELKSAWFEAGYGGVTRVAPENYIEWVPLPEKSRWLAYEASPAFAELRPYLDKTGDDDDFSLSRFGEMTGTWFVWAFRDAAAATGHHDTLPHARDYYLRIAGEIDAACAAGTVACAPDRRSLAPPWRPEYLEASIRGFGKLARILLSMEQVAIEQFASVGGPDLIAPFTDIVHMRVDGMGESPGPRGVIRQELLRAIRDVYAAVLTVAALAASFVLLAGTVLAVRRRALPPALLIAWAVASAIGARLALLAYISVSSYPIYQGLYLRVLYPPLYVFIGLCAAYAVSEWKQRRPARDRSNLDEDAAPV